MEDNTIPKVPAVRTALCMATSDAVIARVAVPPPMDEPLLKLVRQIAETYARIAASAEKGKIAVSALVVLLHTAIIDKAAVVWVMVLDKPLLNRVILLSAPNLFLEMTARIAVPASEGSQSQNPSRAPQDPLVD